MNTFIRTTHHKIEENILMIVKGIISTMRQKIKIRYLENISQHFSWYSGIIPLGVLLIEGWKNKTDFDNENLILVRNEVLRFVSESLFKKISKCYLFLARKNDGTRVNNYYKIWKYIARKNDLSWFNSDEEISYQNLDNKYFVGLATFFGNDLNRGLELQMSYPQYSFILLDVSSNDNSVVDLELLANLFLDDDSNEGFNSLIQRLPVLELLLIRFGDGGEDMEFSLIYPTGAGLPSN